MEVLAVCPGFQPCGSPQPLPKDIWRCLEMFVMSPLGGGCCWPGLLLIPCGARDGIRWMRRVEPLLSLCVQLWPGASRFWAVFSSVERGRWAERGLVLGVKAAGCPLQVQTVPVAQLAESEPLSVEDSCLQGSLAKAWNKPRGEVSDPLHSHLSLRDHGLERRRLGGRFAFQPP